MYSIPNVNGTYRVGNADVVVTDESIEIYPVGQNEIQEYKPQPVARRNRGEPVVRIQPSRRQARVQQQENTQDKLANSVLKTTKFMNEFLWGNGK